MLVAVLLIAYRGADLITVHDNEAAAWSELCQFVDTRWTERFPKSERPKPKSDEARVQQFFENADGSFVLGQADLSEVEAQFDAATATLGQSS